ncbi:MAG TPA: hypothetical protein VEC57_20015 [Candidatus Limnocylindrales bacterium]|nr:hypothetical protein [Candidatus Limnocylindrales bacterium]
MDEGFHDPVFLGEEGIEAALQPAPGALRFGLALVPDVEHDLSE